MKETKKETKTGQMLPHLYLNLNLYPVQSAVTHSNLSIKIQKPTKDVSPDATNPDDICMSNIDENDW